jgi:dihydroorotate dehydrogenase electron transfer subunit
VAEVRVLVGAKESCDLVLLDRLVGLGVHVASATEDGSVGQRGLVTDLLEGDLRTPAPLRARVLACGPEAMLRAVREVTRRHGVECYLSLEAPMACGLGACMGCAVPARERPYLYVCQDGPVVRAEEVWP